MDNIEFDEKVIRCKYKNVQYVLCDYTLLWNNSFDEKPLKIAYKIFQEYHDKFTIIYHGDFIKALYCVSNVTFIFLFCQVNKINSFSINAG